MFRKNRLNVCIWNISWLIWYRLKVNYSFFRMTFWGKNCTVKKYCMSLYFAVLVHWFWCHQFKVLWALGCVNQIVIFFIDHGFWQRCLWHVSGCCKKCCVEKHWGNIQNIVHTYKNSNLLMECLLEILQSFRKLLDY